MNHKRDPRIWLVVSLLFVVLARQATGRTIYVDIGGGGETTSIQAAINVAVSGVDEIEVAPGTYYEVINLLGKAITLQSFSDQNDTIINGLQSGYPVITCASGEDANTVIRGFTIAGGNNSLGGGMYNYGSSPKVQFCNFINNTADTGGGMGNWNGSNPIIESCYFKYNSEVYWGGAMYNYNSNPAISDSTFERNSAGTGGGITNQANSAPILTNCTIKDNHAYYNGGGMYNENSFVDLIGCQFLSNMTADAYDGDGGSGGGMYNINSQLNLTDCLFKDNNTGRGEDGGPYEDGSHGGSGGAVFNNSSTIILQNCTFINNWTGSGGDGAYSDLDPGMGGNGGNGGAMASFASSITAESCNFYYNYTGRGGFGGDRHGIGDGDDGGDGGWGGGICNVANTKSIYMDCIFQGNYTGLGGRGGEGGSGGSDGVDGVRGVGGGLFINSDLQVSVSDCSFVSNAAYWGGGLILGITHPQITGCTFFENQADVGGGIYSTESNPAIDRCVFTGNRALYEGGGCYLYLLYPVITNCCFTGNFAGNGAAAVSNYSQSTFSNCTLTGNWAFGGPGGSLASYANMPENTPLLTNCILWGDLPGEIAYWPFAPFVSYCDVQGGWPVGAGNINVNPNFIDPGHWDHNSTPTNLADDFWVDGDYRLQLGSQCVDSGDPLSSFGPNAKDLSGSPRLFDSSCGDTLRVDIGAYEFNYTYMGDLDYNCTVDFFDFSIFGRTWMTQKGDLNWNWLCDISDPLDDYIDWRDVAILCDNWLAHIP